MTGEKTAAILSPEQYVAGKLAEIQALREEAARKVLTSVVAVYCDAHGLEFRLKRPHGRGVTDGVTIEFLDESRPGGEDVVVYTDGTHRLSELVLLVSRELYSIPACRYAEGKWTFDWAFPPMAAGEKEPSDG